MLLNHSVSRFCPPPKTGQKNGIISTPKIAQTSIFGATCGGHSLTFCLLKFRRPLRQAVKTAQNEG